LLGEMRQLFMILAALTLPTLGSARSMSNTFAVCRNAGGSSSSSAIDALPALRSRFELRAKRSRLVGDLERGHALIQAALGCRRMLLERVAVGHDNQRGRVRRGSVK
jgi:hypothetical protein